MNLLKLKSIKIGPHTIAIKEVEGLAEKENALGRYLPWAQTIEIDASLLPTMALQVRIHEIVHAMNDVFDLKIAKEDLVDRHATAWTTLFLDNQLLK